MQSLGTQPDLAFVTLLSQYLTVLPNKNVFCVNQPLVLEGFLAFNFAAIDQTGTRALDREDLYEFVENGANTILHIPSDYIHADICTKALPGPKI